MKKFSWAAAALLLMILVVLGIGCSTDKGPGGGNDIRVAFVQVFLPTDTLRFLPGDSASADGWVVVTDNAGRTMPGIKVDISLTQPFGFIEYINTELRDTTDTNGKVYFRFRSFNQSGNNTIVARVGNISDQFSFVVQAANNVIRFLNLSLDRNNLQVAPGREDSVLVTCSISDSASNGVPGITLPLRADGGRLQPASPTDPTGRVSTWWYSNGQFATFTITVALGGLSDWDTVRVTPLDNIYGTLDVSATPKRIHADRGVTSAMIQATLKNQHGVAVAGDTVWFATPYLGSVTSFGITDDQGVAAASFRDRLGVPSQNPLDSALVVARYPRWGLTDTVRIFVSPESPVANVSLTMSPMFGVAARDSAAIRVDVTYEDGSSVTGRAIRFWTTCGSFTHALDTLVVGSVGPDQYYKFCNQTTSAANVVEVWATVDGISSDTLRPTVNPGPPRFVYLFPSSNVGYVNTQLPVWAIVTDSLSNSVRDGVTVSFETNLGAIHPSFAPTNFNGRADANLNPGTAAGSAQITAKIGGGLDSSTVLVQILSGVASSIRLTVSNSSPQVQGTGGEDWTQLIASVYDANGNGIPDGQWVIFEILDDPGEGCNINRHGTIDSTQTAGGIAMATFNAGTNPGPVTIEARTTVIMDPDTFEYSATASNINIVAGPPREIDVQAAVIGEEAANGDAAWEVPVVALVRDLYNNPVRDGIAVFFDVTPDTAAILSDTVVTGNGLHNPGVAYSALRYVSAATNEMVWITARTADETVSETVPYRLPLQEPTIQLYCLPATWHYGAPGQGDPCRIECMSVVTDGFGIEINNAKVIYSATRGRFYLNQNGTGPANWRLTGPVGSGDPNFDNGHTSLWLVEAEQFIFPDPLSPEITGDVQVEVEGYSDAIDSQTINFRR